MAKQYYISPIFDVHPQLIRTIGGVAYNLKGVDVTKTVKETTGCCGSEQVVEYDETIKGASQVELEKVYQEEIAINKPKKRRIVWVRDVANASAKKK